MDYKDYLEQKKETGMHFWYRARLLLFEYLLKKLFSKNKKDRIILNIGCGTGTENKIIKQYGQLTALDINKNALREANKDDCQTLLGDIELVDLKKKYFDLICAFDILEHLEQDELVLAKIFASLKSGGKFIFTVPAYSFLYASHDIALGHKRRYNKKEIEQKLKIAGFKFIEIAYWNSILFPFQAIFRILKKGVFKILKIEKHTTEIKYLNKSLNKLLYFIMKQDIRLIRKKMGLPFGLTIYGIVEKE